MILLLGMLTSLEIENFKAFRYLKIEELAKVNLFVGEANTGKTTLLEGLARIAFHHPAKREEQLRLLPMNAFNRPDDGAKTEVQRWLPSNLAVAQIPKISYRSTNGGSYYWPPDEGVLARAGSKAGIDAPEVSVVPTTRLDPSVLARRFDHWTLREGDEDRFVNFAQAVDLRIKGLRPKEHTGVRMLYASIGLPELIPLPLLGEGLNRLIEIYGAIIGEGADIVLIDEIENGLHWNAHSKVWEGIRAVVAAEDVQIFATTHSLECITAAVEVFKGPPLDDLAVHRLERRKDGKIHCVTMDEVTLERMLERGWEVR